MTGLFMGCAAANTFPLPYIGLIQTIPMTKKLGGTATNVFTFTPGTAFKAGNKVILGICHFGSARTISSVTFNSTAAVQAKTQFNTPMHTDIWCGVAGSGSAGVTITLSNSDTTYLICGGIERDDIASTTAEVTAGGNATATSAGSVFTTLGAKTVVFTTAVGEDDSTVAAVSPTGYTQVFNDADGASEVNGAGAWNLVTPAGLQNVSFTSASSHKWASAVAAFTLLS